MGLRTFTFDGTASSDFDMFITEASPYNAPARTVEMIEIPGRNGAYALDKGNFENVEQTYHVVVHGSDDADFREMMSDVRNWLCSKVGYCRLSDDYNPGEYRMATYKSGLETDDTFWNGAEFDVTFDCKPQRYLAIGEELVEIGAWGNTETAEGEIVTIDASSDTAIKALTADIDPIQDLHGYDAPWVGGAGKNKMPQQTDSMIACRFSEGETLTVSCDTATNGASVVFNYYRSDQTRIDYWTANQSIAGGRIGKTFTLTEDVYYIAFTNSTASRKQIEIASSATSYEPYENICPISGHTEVDVVVSPTTDAADGTTYTTQLGQTVYGGTLDVVSGVLTVTHGFKTFDGSESWGKETRPQSYDGTNFFIAKETGVASGIDGYRCNVTDKYSPSYIQDGIFVSSGYWNFIIGNAIGVDTVEDFKTWLSTNNIQLMYPLATPQTYQLTPQQVELLLGENHIFADSGNVTVEYGHNPTLLTNPTWFPSKPLLAVEGYGLLKLGNSEIDLDNVPVGDITLLDDGRFKLTQTAANTYSVTFTIDEGALNVGDDITASINALPFRFYIVGNGASISPSSYTVADTNSDFVSSLSLGYGGSSADFAGETVINVKFDSGTSSTITNTVSGDLVVNKTYPTPTSNITLTYSVTETVAYDASTHTITLTETATITYSSAYISSAQLRTTSLGASALITAYSTISIIQDEVFIDCDIGEAYTIKDGEPISLNQHIDLGSDLPTLPSGDTEVTYDNTITKVEVKPNWWKV